MIVFWRLSGYYSSFRSSTSSLSSSSSPFTTMSTPARRRLMRDFKKLQEDPPAGVSGAPTENNIMVSDWSRLQLWWSFVTRKLFYFKAVLFKLKNRSVDFAFENARSVFCRLMSKFPFFSLPGLECCDIWPPRYSFRGWNLQIDHWVHWRISQQTPDRSVSRGSNGALLNDTMRPSSVKLCTFGQPLVLLFPDSFRKCFIPTSTLMVASAWTSCRFDMDRPWLSFYYSLLSLVTFLATRAKRICRANCTVGQNN